MCCMSDKKVKKIVVLMRHGIRAPNQTMQKLTEWSKREWPVWSVPPGHLTERGRELLKAFWEQYRIQEPFKSLLFGDNSCITLNDVFIHADISERTQASAAVFASTIAPECELPYFITTNKELDPVYHPVRGAVCKSSRGKAENEISTLVETSFSKLAEKYSDQLNFVNELLGPIPKVTCQGYGIDDTCQLIDLPARVNFANSGRTINLRGAMGIKATLIQNWLLESAEWPDRDPGWGLITPDRLSELLVARSAIFNFLNRVDGYSRDRGSAILNDIAGAVSGTHYDPKVNEAKLVMYMGHDTNMAHISELLGFEWDLDGWAYNDIPPGSFLQFTLWEKSAGQEVVTAEFIAQPLNVMRSASPDQVLPYFIKKELSFKPQSKGASSTGESEYSVERFGDVVQDVINSDCIPEMPLLTKGTLF